MTITLHQRLVGGLVTAGCSTHGFKERILDAAAGRHGSHEPVLAVSSAPASAYVACDRCLLQDGMSEYRIVPDAFRIDEAHRDIVAYEVEVAHRLPDWKLERYTEWFWAIDEFEWLLRLVIVDRFGNQHEIDLLAERFGRHRAKAARAELGIRRPMGAT